jgi:hypothetical protein
MELWECIYCQKKYVQKGRIMRHLASIHRKHFYPNQIQRESGEISVREIADKCLVKFEIIGEKV